MHEHSIRKVVRLAAWTLGASITLLSLVPPELRPQTGAPHSIEHFTIFALTGFAFSLAYACRQGLLLIALVTFTGLIEVAQLFVPGRHARFGDFIVDALAMCFGSMAVSLFNAIYTRT
jgi:VanZ family protein